MFVTRFSNGKVKSRTNFLIVEKYLNGLRIENEKLILKKTIWSLKGDTSVDFKINRINDNIYLSVEGDILYVGEIEDFKTIK